MNISAITVIKPNKFALIALLLSSIALSGQTFHSYQKQQAQSHLNRIEALFKRQKREYRTGLTKTAAQTCAEIIAIDPKNVRAYKYRAYYLGLAGDFYGQIATIKSAIQLAPQDLWLYECLGCAYSNHGLHPEAAKAYSQCIKIAPNKSTFRINRGLDYLDAGQYEEALVDFNDVIASDPSNYYGYRNRGWLRECQNDFSSAIADYNQAHKVAPQMTYIYKDLHRVHNKTGQFKLALMAANQAIKSSPVTAEGYYLRALTKLKMQDKAGARSDLNQCIQFKLHPQAAHGLLKSLENQPNESCP